MRCPFFSGRPVLAVGSSDKNVDGTMHASQRKNTKWQLKLGIGMLGLSILLPVAGVPLVAKLGLSATATATVSGALLVAAEVMGIDAIA